MKVKGKTTAVIMVMLLASSTNASIWDVAKDIANEVKDTSTRVIEGKSEQQYTDEAPNPKTPESRTQAPSKAKSEQAHKSSSLGKEGSEVSKQSNDMTLAEQKKATTEALQIQQEEIVQQYVVAAIVVADAQILLAEALGLKKEAAGLRVENELLGSRNTFDTKALKRHAKATKNTNKIVNKRLGKQHTLSGDSKITYFEGLVKYTEGILLSKAYIDALEPFVQRTKEFAVQNAKAVKDQAQNKNTRWALLETIGSRVDLVSQALSGKFRVSAYLTKESAGFMSTHASTLKSAISFAEHQGIEVPEVELDFI